MAPSRKILAERHLERRAKLQELYDEDHPAPEPEALPPVQQAIDQTYVFEPTDIEPPDLLDTGMGSRQVAMQPWRTALMMALKRRMKGKGHPQALHRIADRVVKMACAGDMNAIAEIGNRLDGKAMQPSEMTINNIKQVSDDELERRLAERIAEASATLLLGPGGESGTARPAGGTEETRGRETVRSESD